MDKIGNVVAGARLKDGSVVDITHNKFHHRAYNKDDRQVGGEFVALDDLLAAIGGELVMEQGPGPAEKKNEDGAGQPEAEPEGGPDQENGDAREGR